MPLFGRHTEVEPEAPPPLGPEEKDVSPRRQSFLWGRRRSSSPATASTVSPPRSAIRTPSPTRRRGLLHRRDEDLSPTRRRSLLHRHDEDPSIVEAHERVMSAEAAERDADRALLQARVAVREAKEHVKRLEQETAEESRLANIKQTKVRDISKRVKPLGRHGLFP